LEYARLNPIAGAKCEFSYFESAAVKKITKIPLSKSNFEQSAGNLKSLKAFFYYFPERNKLNMLLF